MSGLVRSHLPQGLLKMGIVEKYPRFAECSDWYASQLHYITTLEFPFQWRRSTQGDLIHCMCDMHAALYSSKVSGSGSSAKPCN